jgi:hypothetical protein
MRSCWITQGEPHERHDTIRAERSLEAAVNTDSFLRQ